MRHRRWKLFKSWFRRRVMRKICWFIGHDPDFCMPQLHKECKKVAGITVCRRCLLFTMMCPCNLPPI